MGTDLPGGRATLLQALKRNSSLLHATTELGFSFADNALMKFYADRNMHIHALLEVSKDELCKPLQVWPRFVHAMQGCTLEVSIIFLSLKALGVSVRPQVRSFEKEAN